MVTGHRLFFSAAGPGADTAHQHRFSVFEPRLAASAVPSPRNSAKLAGSRLLRTFPGESHDNELLLEATRRVPGAHAPCISSCRSPRSRRCRRFRSPRNRPRRASPSRPARRRWIAVTANRPTTCFAPPSPPIQTSPTPGSISATSRFSTEEFNAALRGGQQGAARASEGERMLLEFNKLFLDNNFNAQLEIAQQLTQKYPDSPRAWMQLAAAQAALNKFAEQRATLEKVIALAPDFSPGAVHPGGILSVQRSRPTSPGRKSTIGRPSASRPVSTCTTGRWAMCIAARTGSKTHAAITSWRCSSIRRISSRRSSSGT